jgi:hypothetical protein
MTIVSDAPSCGVIHDHHSDNSKGVIALLENIYSACVTRDDHHIIIEQATHKLECLTLASLSSLI